MSIEEKLSKSILYNLNILRKIVRSSEQLDEIITDGIFLKSNTQTFIQVTYFLFNIIDAKEFKKQFYWPICDKKSENSYRTSSVEMINMLIDKYSLQQEKIKQVTVVHPSGKKFMSLMLDLILIAIKELMKRKKYSSSKSMDINEVMTVATTINQVENDIMDSLRSDLLKIKEKTQAAQEVHVKIYKGEIEFEEMIASWHSLNVTRLSTIKRNNEKLKEVFKNVKLLQQKAEDKLNDKKFVVTKLSKSEMEKISEFYQYTDVPNENGNKLSILSLIAYLQSTLPIILNYVKNFSYDQAEVSDEEMKIVNLKLAEIEKFDSVISKMKEQENFIKEKILKLKSDKEQQQLEDMSLIEESEEKIIKDAEDQEALRPILSPSYQFDTSRNCMNIVPLKRNRLVFAENEDEHIVDRSMMLNQTKHFVDMKSINNRSRNDDMGPPKNLPQPQKNRRRRDAMQLLEQATSNNKKFDFNLTKYGSNKVVYSTPLSSTLVSPDLIHHHRANLDFSMISSISTICETPAAAALRAPNINVPKTFTENVQPIMHNDMYSKDEIENFPRTEIQIMKENQKSPVTKVNSMISLEEAFGEDLTNLQQLPKCSSPLSLPKIFITTSEDDTIKNISEFSNEMEKTVRANENVVNESQESDEPTTIFRKRHKSEDLFDISDSLLVND